MPNVLTLELPPSGEQTDGLGNALPLRGVTVLAVEDSRFASEALRLMCRRLGARLRRAESLTAAASHLKLYRPDVVIIDLGLPDGRGEALIRETAGRTPRPVILATSGDPEGRWAALAAGADDFLDKPLDSLAGFRSLLMRHLPGHAGDATPGAETALVPDMLALRDDLAHAAALLEKGGDDAAYVSGFVRGVARHAHDRALAEATGVEEMRALLKERLTGPDHAFDRVV